MEEGGVGAADSSLLVSRLPSFFSSPDCVSVCVAVSVREGRKPGFWVGFFACQAAAERKRALIDVKRPSSLLPPLLRIRPANQNRISVPLTASWASEQARPSHVQPQAPSSAGFSDFPSYAHVKSKQVHAASQTSTAAEDTREGSISHFPL